MRAAFDTAVASFGGADIVVSNAGVASSAPIEETSLDEWNRNHAVLGTGYSWSRARRSACCANRARAAPSIFVASKNALVAGKNAAAYSSAKAAELHLARCLAEEGGSAGIRTRSTPTPSCKGRGSRARRGEPSAPRPTASPRTSSRSTTASEPPWRAHPPEDIAERVIDFASPAAAARVPGTCSTWTRVPAADSR